MSQEQLDKIGAVLDSVARQIEECIPAYNEFEDTYEYYTALATVYQRLQAFADDYLKQSDELMKHLVNNADEVSDKYELIFPANSKRTVDMAKLQENKELFDKCAFVKDAFITKALGRKRLRDMFCEEYGGMENAFSFMTANVTDLEKAVGKSDAAKYLVVDAKRTEVPMIVAKDSYPADHYKRGESEVTRVFLTNPDVKPPKAFSKVKISTEE